MNLIYSYKNLHKQLLVMIESAREYVYIFSWDFNIRYDKRIEKAIINATRRGTHVYLMTGGKHVNPIGELIGLKNEFFHLKYKFQIGPKRQPDILQTLFNFQTEIDHMYYNHMRFALNEKTFLLGGVNVSSLYEGNLKRNMREYNFCWFDSGLRMENASECITPFIDNLFSNMDFEMKREVKSLSSSITIIHDNYTAYKNIINAIRTSKNRIYIENQYFASHPEITYNEFAYELGMRINKAIKENEDFHVQLVLNYRNYDETNSVQLSMTSICIKSLYYMRSLVKCDDKTFYKYVDICMPRDDIDIKCIIHTKIFIVDDTHCLFTTANLNDRCMSRIGEFELGLQFTDTKTVSSLYSQSIAHFNKHKHLFMKFHLQNPDATSCFLNAPKFFEFLMIKPNYSMETVEFNMNDCTVMETFINIVVNPAYSILLDTSFQEVVGVRVKLT